jgi:hypothetical protein
MIATTASRAMIRVCCCFMWPHGSRAGRVVGAGPVKDMSASSTGLPQTELQASPASFSRAAAALVHPIVALVTVPRLAAGTALLAFPPGGALLLLATSLAALAALAALAPLAALALLVVLLLVAVRHDDVLHRR